MGTRKRQASCWTLRSGLHKRLHLVGPCPTDDHCLTDDWRVLDEFLTQRRKEQGSEPSLPSHTTPVNRVLTTAGRFTQQEQSSLWSWGTHGSHGGESIFWLWGQTLGFYICLRKSICNTNKSFQYPWGFVLLFVWVAFNYSSTKHLAHCVSKFTACWGPFKFLFESKRTWDCGGDLRNIMSSSHRLWSSFVL